MRLIIACLLLMLPINTWAQTSAPDQAQFKDVINRQISAFKVDDSVTAFGFASPDLQAKFGNADIFMEMVRSSYAPVYRPRFIEFRDIIEHDQETEQQVFLVGPDGRNYLAHYMMERQPDGSWRINACYLETAQDESV